VRARPSATGRPTRSSPEGTGDRINAFAAHLFRRLAGEQGSEKGNLFLSPFSLETALGMTAAGARGETLDEMRAALRLPADPHPAFGALLSPAQPARRREAPLRPLDRQCHWAQQGFPWEKSFAALTAKHYGTGLREIDFAESDAARRRINAWVAEETRQKVKDLIPEGVITALTRMVLANAVYFKSNWRYRFDPKRTTDAKFTRDDGTTADVPLMSLADKLNHGVIHVGPRKDLLTVQVVELPYAGNDLSMLVFLPEKGKPLARLAHHLTGIDLNPAALAAAEVRVFLPRFKARAR
jgi:serpin B